MKTSLSLLYDVSKYCTCYFIAMLPMEKQMWGILTGLAGVRGQLGLFTSPYSSCIELRLAAPGEGTVLCGVGGWLW
jgi:hypothetical protein